MTIIKAKIEDMGMIENLMNGYLWELNKYELNEVVEEYKYLKLYWDDVERHPYLIQYNYENIGFVLVNKHGISFKPDWAIAEFYIIQDKRNRGLGNTAAIDTFSNHHGNWEVVTNIENTNAVKFWNHVIHDYTVQIGSQFSKTIYNNQVVFTFNNSSA